jgi:ribosomal protein S4
MKQFHTDKNSLTIDKNPISKLIKLKYLLENSENQGFVLSHSFQEWNNHDFKGSLENQNFVKKTSSQLINYDLSKDFSLYLSLVEKPINLLFSMDQFVFEFSKKTYQQKKTGEFFQQLKERKKLSLFYGNLTQKQILNLFNQVKKNKGYFAKNVFSLLERRLDVVLYRTGLTKTIAEARQLIRHKKILVNQKIINVPSLLLTPGDFISVTQKTEDVLSNQLINSLKTKGQNQNFERVKNHSRIFGNFYSKLKKTLDFSFVVEKTGESLKSKNFGSILENNRKENFQSKLLCNFWMELLCLKIKTRSYWFSTNKINGENSCSKNFILDKNRKKSCLTMFKWKFFSHKKNSRKSLQVKRNSNSEQNLFANTGCLQKKPIFWSLSNSRQPKKVSFKYSQKLESLTEQTFHSHSGKKHVKIGNFKKKNLALHRKNFLLFFKHLENYKKFTTRVSLSVKKFLLNKSFYKQKFGSKNLTFRLLRPLNIEVSYNLLNFIYLYSPQKVNFPFSMDLDLIKRSLR